MRGAGMLRRAEHIISIVASLVKNCEGIQRQRLINKFTENDHEKIDRLMELHFKYLDRVNKADDKIEQKKRVSKPICKGWFYNLATSVISFIILLAFNGAWNYIVMRYQIRRLFPGARNPVYATITPPIWDFLDTMHVINYYYYYY